MLEKTVTLRTVLNCCLAFVIIDLIYFSIGAFVLTDFSGEIFVPSSWTVEFFMSPPDARMYFRDILGVSLLGLMIFIIGYTRSIIAKNV